MLCPHAIERKPESIVCYITSPFAINFDGMANHDDMRDGLFRSLKSGHDPTIAENMGRVNPLLEIEFETFWVQLAPILDYLNDGCFVRNVHLAKNFYQYFLFYRQCKHLPPLLFGHSQIVPPSGGHVNASA